MVRACGNVPFQAGTSSWILSQGCMEATWGPRRIWEVRSSPVVNINSEERETMQTFLITNKEKWEVLKYVEDQHSK